MQKEEQEYLYETIGNEIKKLRIKSRFSQDQLAKKLDLSRVSVVNIEKGRQHPSVHLIIDIARILNVPLSTFINDNILNDFDNKTKLNQLKKKLSKKPDGFDQEKIMEFIEQHLSKK